MNNKNTSHVKWKGQIILASKSCLESLNIEEHSQITDDQFDLILAEHMKEILIEQENQKLEDYE